MTEAVAVPAVEGSSMVLPGVSESCLGGSSTRVGSATPDGVDRLSAVEKRLQQEQEQYKALRYAMERRRDDFRVYLDQSGVMDKLSKGKEEYVNVSLTRTRQKINNIFSPSTDVRRANPPGRSHRVRWPQNKFIKVE